MGLPLLLLTAGGCNGDSVPGLRMQDGQGQKGTPEAVAAMGTEEVPSRKRKLHDQACNLGTTRSGKKFREEGANEPGITGSGGSSHKPPASGANSRMEVASASSSNRSQPAHFPLEEALEQHVGNTAKIVISYMDADDLLESFAKVDSLHGYAKIIKAFAVLAEKDAKQASGLLRKVAFLVVDKLFRLAQKDAKNISPCVKATIHPLAELVHHGKLSCEEIDNFSNSIIGVSSVNDDKLTTQFFGDTRTSTDTCKAMLQATTPLYEEYEEESLKLQEPLKLQVLLSTVSLFIRALHDDNEYGLYEALVPESSKHLLKPESYTSANDSVRKSILELVAATAQVVNYNIENICMNPSDYSDKEKRECYALAVLVKNVWKEGSTDSDTTLRNLAQRHTNDYVLSSHLLGAAECSSSEAFLQWVAKEERDAE